jgi:hypothetical protein
MIRRITINHNNLNADNRNAFTWPTLGLVFLEEETAEKR